MADVDNEELTFEQWRVRTSVDPYMLFRRKPDGTYVDTWVRKELAAWDAGRAPLLARIAELELLADDARGKRCPECSAPMVSLSTIDGGQRVCSGCDKVWSWHLKEGQPPLIGNNRMVKKV